MNTKTLTQFIIGLAFLLSFSVGNSQCTLNPKVIIDSTFGMSKTLNNNTIHIEGQTFKWNPSKGLSCSDCLKPIFLFSVDTTVNYTLTIYDENLKCIRIDQFKIVSKKQDLKQAYLYRDLDIHELQEDQIGQQGFISNSDIKVNESAPSINVEEQAYFLELKAFLKKNLKYPETAIEDAISGKCYLTFIVSETGIISSIKVSRGVPGCPECDQEAVRIIKLMPAWAPARIGGKPVKSYFNLSVPFNLD